MRTLKRHKKRPTIPSKDEIRTLLAAAEDGLERTILVVDTFSGMRLSEIRGLMWRDIDFDAETITVERRADKWRARIAEKCGGPEDDSVGTDRSQRIARVAAGVVSWRRVGVSLPRRHSSIALEVGI